MNINKIYDEEAQKNILIALGLHCLFSLGFWFLFLLFEGEFTIWSDLIGWISYLIVGLFIKVSERRIQNIVSASFITIIGLIYWSVIFSIYVHEMNDESWSFFGPEFIWIIYLPYVHGSYFILNLIDNVDLIPYILSINNIGISVFLYLIIIIKKRIRKL